MSSRLPSLNTVSTDLDVQFDCFSVTCDIRCDLCALIHGQQDRVMVGQLINKVEDIEEVGLDELLQGFEFRCLWWRFTDAFSW